MREAFGKYTLERRLAFGGMAEVFLGSVHGEAGFNKRVVIKRLHPHLNEDDEFVSGLIDEAKITALLTHSNICQVLDLGSVDDFYYIAMEFVAGEDLKTLQDHFIRRKAYIPIEVALYITSEMLAGLHYAHTKEGVDGESLGVVHRDVSPQNVLVSYEGEVKVIDFGIAQAKSRLVKTQAGVIKGKFRYMSPEQASGLQLDSRTDVFAAGVVLYEMLRGAPHSKKLSDTEVLKRMREASFEPIKRTRDEVPDTLLRIVARALAQKPRKRFQSCAEMRQAILRFLQSRNSTFGRSELAALMKEVFPLDRRRMRSGIDVSQDKSESGKNTHSNPPVYLEPTEASFDDQDVHDLRGTPTNAHTKGSPIRSSQKEVSQKGENALSGVRGKGYGSSESVQASRSKRRAGAFSKGEIQQTSVVKKQDWRELVKDEEKIKVDRQDLAPHSSPLSLTNDIQTNQRLTIKYIVGSLLFFIGVLGAFFVGKHFLFSANEKVENLPTAEAKTLKTSSSKGTDSSNGGEHKESVHGNRSVKLVLSSHPTGADIYWCGKKRNRLTPTTLVVKKGRLCRLVFKKNGYDSYSRSMRAKKKRTKVFAKLKKHSDRFTPRVDTVLQNSLSDTVLIVTSIQVGTVYVNGRAMGKTPRARIMLRPGKYRVYVSFARLAKTSATRTIVIKKGDHKSLYFDAE